MQMRPEFPSPGVLRSVVTVVLSALLGLTFAVPIRAQDTVTGAFDGLVTDSRTGNPIAQATVQIINRYTQVPVAKRTDAQGRFYQGLLQPGIYTIRVSAPSYQTNSVDQRLIATKENRVQPVPIKLDPEAPPTPSSTPTPAETTPTKPAPTPAPAIFASSMTPGCTRCFATCAGSFPNPMPSLSEWPEPAPNTTALGSEGLQPAPGLASRATPPTTSKPRSWPMLLSPGVAPDASMAVCWFSAERGPVVTAVHPAGEWRAPAVGGTCSATAAAPTISRFARCAT